MTAKHKWRVWAVHLVLGVVAGFGTVHAALAESVLRINGTGSGTGGMQLLAEAYMQANPTLRVVVAPAIGSTGGIRALLDGKLDVALSNREPNEAERARAALTSVEYARTPFVVAVHKNVGIAALTGAQLAALFEPGATYPSGQRARPVLRSSDATDTKLFQSMAPGLVAAVDAAAARRGMLEAATDTEAADMVQQTAGAFAASTLALIATERRPFVALAIDGREPTVDSLALGRYPYHKRLFVITHKTPAQGVAAFMAFVRSPAAQALLRANGHLPL